MANRSVRSLERLERSASTARVLNLRAVARLKGGDPDYLAHPLFQNATLNASIIVKHRLRVDELEQFGAPRGVATKILIPIDANDLRLGARYVFIGQRQFERALFDAFGLVAGDDNRDLRVLEILDETPTLDPFLLREQLRRHGLEPARCYFDLSPGDSQRMFDFAQREIEPLVRMSVGPGDADFVKAGRLTRVILANAADAALEPLRQTMQLDPQQFQEGVFCWKAFLYYKWQLADLLPRVGPVLKQIGAIRPRGPQTDEIRIYLSDARETLCKALLDGCRRVRSTLAIYDQAYARLTQHSDPSEFRDFLLRAPALFNALGERLGGIEHMLSFWRFRFPGDKPPVISADELCDLFMDFEGSLGFDPAAEASPAPPSAAAPLTLAI
jgi:hypothetical protein